MKNKFKILIFIIAILIFTCSTVMAVDAGNTVTTPDTANNVNTNNTTNTNSGDSSQALANQNAVNDDSFKKEDVYLVGDNVTIDYIVDGNLFVMANTVTINSQIGGDAFILSDNLIVGENGYIFSNLFAACSNITINGIVYDLYSISNNTNINGYVYRDMRSTSSNNINILGTIGRNAYISCDNINFKSEIKNEQANENQTNNEADATNQNQTGNENGTADENQTNNGDETVNEDKSNNENETTTVTGNISGNLNYSSKKEISVPDGVVAGKVNFEQIKNFDNNKTNNLIIKLATFVFTVIAIWLVCLWLTPKFIKNASTLVQKKALPVIGLGILTPIALTILSILLLVLGVTSTLGLLLFIALFVFIALSTSIFVITINNIICNKLKITKTKNVFGVLVISSIALWLIGVIPFIGSIISLFAVILGLGIIVYSLIFKNKLSTIAEETK